MFGIGFGAKAREMVLVLRLGGAESQCRGGRGGLKAKREEHDLAVGVLLGDAQSVERRVHDPYVGPLRLGLQPRLTGHGHQNHVAKAGENQPWLVREGDAVVDATHRDDAYGASGAVHELDVGGQQVVNSVLVDRVRVTTADLHDLVMPVGLSRCQDLPGDRSAELRVSELVDELQAGSSRSAARARAVPAWTSRTSPDTTGSTSPT